MVFEHFKSFNSFIRVLLLFSTVIPLYTVIGSFNFGEILKIANKGPNLKMNEENTGLKSVPPYFSLKWYFSKAN